MIGWVLFLLTVTFYAKPVYWGAKTLYAAVKRDYPAMNTYKEKFIAWTTVMWALVKWQKGDL